MDGFYILHLLVFPIQNNNMASDPHNNPTTKDYYLLRSLQKCYVKTIIELLVIQAATLASWKLRYSIWRCMHRESYCNMYINQQDAQVLVIGLYFPLDALHVSNFY